MAKLTTGSSRRTFLRWATATGAALAVERSDLLNIISDSGGSALADDATCSASARSVHIVAGNGGFAWFQLLWPHIAVAQANNDNFAYHAIGQGMMAADSDKPLFLGPDAPWQKYGKAKYVSAFMAGTNETHDPTPASAAQLGNNQSMLAVAAAIQRVSPSLIPVIGVEPLNFGAAPGAPAPTTVGDADGLVQLFNSAASRAILSVPEDAEAFESYYKAFVGLNKAAGRATQLRGLRVGKQAANFLGKNLALQLMPSNSDLARYGVDAGTPNKLEQIARTLITTVKAFKLGLTQSVILPAMRDDPHGAFGDMGTLNSTISTLGKILDGFMDDMTAADDPSCSARNLGENVVVTVHGDTPKDPFARGGWPDGTPNNSNWIYVMGNGATKTGWHGGANPDGSTDGFDPTTGAVIQNQVASTTTAAAGAAVAFAIAKGDMRRVRDFYQGKDIDGIVNINPIQ